MNRQEANKTIQWHAYVSSLPYNFKHRIDESKKIVNYIFTLSDIYCFVLEEYQANSGEKIDNFYRGEKNGLLYDKSNNNYIYSSAIHM